MPEAANTSIFRVNQRTEGSHSDLSITGLAGGGAVLSWTDQYGDGSSTCVKARVFDASGAEIGKEILVNTNTAGGQFDSGITRLANGGFIISWTDDDANGHETISSQVFSAKGAKIGSEVHTDSIGNSTIYTYSVAPLANGGFAASWWDVPNRGAAGTISVKAQVFAADGSAVTGALAVNTITDVFDPSVIALTNGRFVVQWEGASQSTHANISAQLFDASGAKIGGEFLVNTALHEDLYPSAAALTGGGFVETWLEAGAKLGDYSYSELKGQLFDGSGGKIGGEFVITHTDEATGTGDPDTLSDPAATALPDGGFLVTWTLHGVIYEQRYGADGAIVGLAHGVTPESDATYQNPLTAVLGSGNYLLAWEQPQGGIDATIVPAAKPLLFTNGADTVDFNGKDHHNYTGPFDNANAGDDTVTLPTTADGLVAFGLQNGFHGGDGNDIVSGGAAAVTIYGDAGSDKLTGSSAGDTLYGGVGADVLAGGGGRDQLYGGDGADTFRFMAISDSLATSAGRDQINDFVVGQDRIDLTAVLGSSFHLVSAFDGHAGAVREDHSAGSEFVTLSIDVDGNRKGDMQIVVHTGGALLTSGDFVMM